MNPLLRRIVLLLVLFGVMIAGLWGITLFGANPSDGGVLTAEAQGSRNPEALAHAVRYSDTRRIDKPAYITVELTGRGDALVSLVEDGGAIYEQEASAPATLTFSGVQPGDWSVRLRALAGAQVEAAITYDAPNWSLFRHTISVLLILFVVGVFWSLRRG